MVVQDVTVIRWWEFDFEWFEKIPEEKLKRGKNGPFVKKQYYKDIVTAFDIETTKVHTLALKVVADSELEKMSTEILDAVKTHALMYIWQWQFGNDICVIGRTWNELKLFIAALAKRLKSIQSLVVFVHNLTHEFQFLKSVLDIDYSSIFAVDYRKVLKFTCEEGKIEFRDSYRLSNMSLSQFTKKMGVKHQKLVGDLDYSVQRYAWTEMSEEELSYCINDVAGLVEAVQKLMRQNNDNLTTLPMTSTGFVRRESKKVMRPYRMLIQDIFPDFELYQSLREAFRGGDTHANRYYADMLLKDVESWDYSSSYPNVMCHYEFPMGKFHKVEFETITLEELYELIHVRHKAVVFSAAFENLTLRDPYCGCPYLSKSKCRHVEKEIEDNGRILEATYLETTLTDIDWDIVVNMYDWTGLTIYNVYHARYGKLPTEYIQLIQSYFKNKTELKNVEGQEEFYEKSKNLLNALYGMFAQNPVIEPLYYDGLNLKTVENYDARELLYKFKRNAFIVYQWAVWTTARARYLLHQVIDIVGDDFIYCDTDSVKFIGNHAVEIEKLNEKMRQIAIDNDSYAYDPKGEPHYMGVLEKDAEYSYFKTLGAKKYMYRKKNAYNIEITIAGVNKTKGAVELTKCGMDKEHGAFDCFTPGFIFYEGGGTESIFNDLEEMTTLELEEGTMELTSNMAIVDSTYKLNMEPDYTDIVKNSFIVNKLIEAYNIITTGCREIHA